jgi:hypothetical protein
MFVSSGSVGPKTRLKSVVEAGHPVNIPELCYVCYQLRGDAEGQTILPPVVEVQARRGIAQANPRGRQPREVMSSWGQTRRSGFHHAAKKTLVVNT